MTVEFILVFLWAVAEATVWPFMPDAVIAPLVAIDPAHWWRVLPPAILGTICGGMLSYAVGRRFSAELVLKLPFIRKPMLAQCRAWLVKEGPRGVRHQALSMLPFKVFCFVAGEFKLPFWRFFCWAVVVRGTRFLCVCLLASGVGNLFRDFLQEHLLAAAMAWALLFSAGLTLMARKWQRTSEIS